MTEHKRRWIRLGLVYLTVSFLEVGLWATFAPRSFYDSFPGFGQPWVAGDGPYNAHLAGDAGLGFLAVGVVLLLAAIWMDRRLMQAALLVAFLHGLLHLFVHLVHPNEDLRSGDALLSNGALFVGLSLSAVLLVTITSAPSGQTIPPMNRRSLETTAPGDVRGGR